MKIYQASKSVTQSGQIAPKWRIGINDCNQIIEFPPGEYVQNKLIGWDGASLRREKYFFVISSLYFESELAARQFCDKNEWDFVVEEPKLRKIVPKVYANNFTYFKSKLSWIHTK